MPLIPRYYQEEAVDSVFTYFMSNKGNPIIAMPTGTGKSLVIAELTKRILLTYPGQRIQMVTHVKTLIEQNFEKLITQWPAAPAGIHSAGLKRRDCLEPIVFGGIQSMYRRAADFGHIDILIVDECHLIPSNSETMYGRYIEELTAINPYLKVVGLSATPYRLKGGHLTDGKVFTDVCYDNTQTERFNRLIDEGFLAPVIPKKTRTEISDKDLHIRAGEFITSEMEELYSGDVTFQALTETVQEGVDREHWLVFAVSIAHTEDIVDLLNHMGISAVACHSEMAPGAADQALKDFAAGKYRAIVSRDKLTTGVDLPEVDLICMLRLTRSPGLWVQMLGRGTRPFPGKQDCLVLDFAGNTRRLGPINDPVLPTTNQNGSNGGGQAPVKVCPACQVYVPAGVRFCEHCGYEFERVMQFDASASTQELIRRDEGLTTSLKVDYVTYQRHKKMNKPDSMCVTYFSGLVRVREYVCPDHNLYAERRAIQWWQARSIMAFPRDGLDGLLAQVGDLPTPVAIIVDLKGPYPELKNVLF